ncbi:hypothetical protein F511_05081 [Dorcoceras hygrometricum]|uniref:Uncharacterized protein n=1 Tax=Dorcoceras hygrometricum TaxID=472368 RepID=A0A2Z7D6D0_9LAMI|nr:hypothetical protein F511_05081 [Dorcoceras hygrometricum]
MRRRAEDQQKKRSAKREATSYGEASSRKPLFISRELQCNQQKLGAHAAATRAALHARAWAIFGAHRSASDQPVAPRLQPSSQHRSDQRSAQRRPNFVQHLATSGGPPRFNCAASARQLHDQRASCGRGRAATLGRLMRNSCAMSRAGQRLRRAASAQVARLIYRQSGPRPDTRLLRHPALEGVTISARMDSPRRIGRNEFRRLEAAAAAIEERRGGYLLLGREAIPHSHLPAGIVATMSRVVNYHSSWARQQQFELFDASGNPGSTAGRGFNPAGGAPGGG